MKITSTNNNSCNFKAIYFENYNNKYNNIQTNLRKELENFSEVLFQRIFQGLKYEYAENILVKGYKNMRQFKYKL